MNEWELSRRGLAAALTLIAAVMVATLWLMGRVLWCQQGDLLPWSWDVWSPHNSQHLVDAYSLSHLEHGLGLYLLLSATMRKWLSVSGIVLTIAIVEAGWEMAENTPWMIQRYREATISLDYYGDSIANSLSDYVMCLVGLLVAHRIRWQFALTLLIGLELVSVLWIRDSLLLNILMLLYPIESIKQWQAAGAPATALKSIVPLAAITMRLRRLSI